MKRLLCLIPVTIFLFSLTGCDAKSDITGVWEQKMEISVLGKGTEAPASIVSLCRFTFREDGTGKQEQIMTDGSYPDVVREFNWQLEDNTLNLNYGGERTETFKATISKTMLKLENNRGIYDLTKAE